jgi:putative ABC transport system permease protein
MSGHVLRGTGRPYRAVEGEPIPDEHREVSAVMLTLADPQAGFFLSQRINGQGKVATLAWPIGRVVAELFDRIGWITQVLALVAYLVVAVAAGSVLASIYNTMNERRREFAILRALGARRAVVSLVIVLEAATITALGVIGGGVVYLGILAVARAVIRAQTGVVLDVLAWHPALWMTPVALLALGALAGLVPAWKAYRTDVADHLSPTS